jgi:hypothetical protein
MQFYYKLRYSTDTLCGQNAQLLKCTASGKYNNHCALKNTGSVRVSGFRREVYENYALLDYYIACNGNLLLTYREKNWILDP